MNPGQIPPPRRIPTIPPLVLAGQRRFNRVQFDDERQRAENGEVSGHAFASITFDAGDGSTSWGEFLSLEEALHARAWLDALIAAAYGLPADPCHSDG